MENEEQKEKYEILVELDDMTCLTDDVIQAIVQEHEFRGKVFTNICIIQTDENSLDPVKKFFLENEEDFSTFAAAIINIPGVKNVRKNNGPWTRTEEEQRLFEEEKEGIQNQKMKLAEEFQKKRQEDLKIFKSLIEERTKLYAERYGLDEDKLSMSIGWERFYQLTASMKLCTGKFFVVFSDILMGGFLEYAHKTIENVSVEEALSFLLKCINEHLVPFVSPLENLDALPFNWDVIEKNGKKLAILTMGCGKPTFVMAQYEFCIEETGKLNNVL